MKVERPKVRRIKVDGRVLIIINDVIAARRELIEKGGDKDVKHDE